MTPNEAHEMLRALDKSALEATLDVLRAQEVRLAGLGQDLPPPHPGNIAAFIKKCQDNNSSMRNEAEYLLTQMGG